MNPDLIKYRNAILWAVDYFGVDGMSRKERAHGVQQLADVLLGKETRIATYIPNDWDDSARLIASALTNGARGGEA